MLFGCYFEIMWLVYVSCERMNLYFGLVGVAVARIQWRDLIISPKRASLA